jgi:hypothetical protein
VSEFKIIENIHLDRELIELAVALQRRNSSFGELEKEYD